MHKISSETPQIQEGEEQAPPCPRWFSIACLTERSVAGRSDALLQSNIIERDGKRRPAGRIQRLRDIRPDPHVAQMHKHENQHAQTDACCENQLCEVRLLLLLLWVSVNIIPTALCPSPPHTVVLRIEPSGDPESGGCRSCYSKPAVREHCQEGGSPLLGFTTLSLVKRFGRPAGRAVNGGT